MRESRSAAVQGPAVPTENNVLTDGTLIDLCGATLLWRSTEGNWILELIMLTKEHKKRNSSNWFHKKLFIFSKV